MKVQRVIEILQSNYSPDTELMITWWGSEAFETKAGVWEKAVEIFDLQTSPNESEDYIKDIVGDAEYELEVEEEKRLKAELAIDTYLQDQAEKGLLI